MHPIAKGLVGLIALFSAGLMPAQAQIRAVDPNTAIDADLAPLPSENANPTPPGQDVTVDSNVYNEQPASDNVVAENRAATSAAPVPATAPVTEANPAVYQKDDLIGAARSEEHTSELQSLMRISYAVFCLKKKKVKQT